MNYANWGENSKTQKSISFQSFNPFKQKKLDWNTWFYWKGYLEQNGFFFFLNRLSIILQTIYFDGHVYSLFLFCKKKAMWAIYNLFVPGGSYLWANNWLNRHFYNKTSGASCESCYFIFNKSQKKNVYIFIASKNTWV